MNDIPSVQILSKFFAEVTEHRRPNNEMNVGMMPLPIVVLSLYKDMVANGGSLHAEMLPNGMVTLTLSHDEDEVDLDCEIVANGPEVIQGLLRMLRRRSWTKDRSKMK